MLSAPPFASEAPGILPPLLSSRPLRLAAASKVWYNRHKSPRKSAEVVSCGSYSLGCLLIGAGTLLMVL